MTGLRRAFVAVVPPPEVLDAVERVVAPVRPVAPPRLNWTHAGQWHLTLQFLGAVDDADELVDALRWGLHGRPPVALALGGAGAFPSARACVGRVDRARRRRAGAGDARRRGAARDRAARATSPTIATSPPTSRSRARRARGRWRASCTSLGDGPVGPVFHVTEVLLMESDTRWDGAVYREVASFPLGA